MAANKSFRGEFGKISPRGILGEGVTHTDLQKFSYKAFQHGDT